MNHTIFGTYSKQIFIHRPGLIYSNVIADDLLRFKNYISCLPTLYHQRFLVSSIGVFAASTTDKVASFPSQQTARQRQKLSDHQFNKPLFLSNCYWYTRLLYFEVFLPPLGFVPETVYGTEKCQWYNIFFLTSVFILIINQHGNRQNFRKN